MNDNYFLYARNQKKRFLNFLFISGKGMIYNVSHMKKDILSTYCGIKGESGSI